MTNGHKTAGIESAKNGESAVKRILQVPEHFHGGALAKLYGPRGGIAKSMKKVQNADILDRAAEARKQVWSLGHFSKGNLETDLLILDAIVYAYFGCDCVNDTTDDFREMLEESLENGTADALGGLK